MTSAKTLERDVDPVIKPLLEVSGLTVTHAKRSGDVTSRESRSSIVTNSTSAPARRTRSSVRAAVGKR